VHQARAEARAEAEAAAEARLAAALAQQRAGLQEQASGLSRSCGKGLRCHVQFCIEPCNVPWMGLPDTLCTCPPRAQGGEAQLEQCKLVLPKCTMLS